MKRLTTVILSLALLGMLACSAELSDVDHVDNARGYIANRELGSAVIELKNALQKNPTNPETRYLLGKTYLELGDPDGAEIELERALDLGLPPQTAIPTLAKALLQLQKYDEVLGLSLAEAAPGSAAESTLMVTQGLAELFRGDLSGAKTRLTTAVERNSTSTYALEGIARLQAASWEFDKSRETLEAIFKLDKNYAAAWSILGQIEQEEGNLDSAEVAYQKAIQLSPNPIDDLLRIALLRLSRNELETAEADINRLEELAANHIGVIYARGVLLFSQGDYEAAQGVFDNLVGVTDRYLPALLYAGATHLKLQNEGSAEQNLQQFVARAPNHPDANRMLATVKLRKGDYEEAERLLTLTLEESPEDPIALFLLAQAVFAQGRPELAAEALHELVALQPDNAPAHVALATALYSNGKLEAAIDELGKAMAMDPKLAMAPASLVKIYLASGEKENAVTTAQSYLDRNQGSPTAHNLLAATYLSVGEDDLALASFQHTISKAPGDLSANGGLAALAVKSGNLDEARKYYQTSLEANPGNLGTLLNLASLELAAGNREEAQQILREAATANPDSLAPLLKLGATLLAEGRAEDIPELLRDIPERHPNNIALLTLLAEGARANSRYNEALQVYQKITRLAPQNPAIRYKLAKSHAAVGDRDGYRKELSETLKLSPYNNIVRLEYAHELLVNGQLEEAEAQADIIREQGRENTALLLLEGQLADARGNSEQAILAYQAVYLENPNNFNLLRLTNAKWKAGDRPGAIELMEKWLADYPEDMLTRLELGNRYIILGKDTDAIAMLETVVKQEGDKTSSLALNNLAWLQRKSDPARALVYAEKAHELFPQSTEVMDTLSLVLLETGEEQHLERAYRLNERARAGMPGNLTYIFHSALIEAANGDKEAAENTLTQLLDTGPNFPEHEEAVMTLQSLQGH